MMRKTGKVQAVAAKGALTEALQIGMALLLMAVVLMQTQLAFGSHKLTLVMDVTDNFELQDQIYVGTHSEVSGFMIGEAGSEPGDSPMMLAIAVTPANLHLMKILEDGSLGVLRIGSELTGSTEPKPVGVLAASKENSSLRVAREVLNSSYRERFLQSQAQNMGLVLANVMKQRFSVQSGLTQFNPVAVLEEPQERLPASEAPTETTPITDEELQVNYTVEFLEDMVCSHSTETSLSCKTHVQLVLELVAKDENLFGM